MHDLGAEPLAGRDSRMKCLTKVLERASLRFLGNPVLKLTSALLARAAFRLPARSDADGWRFLVGIQGQHAWNVGRKALPDSSGAQYRKRDASGDAGLAVDMAREDLPPVAARGLALGAPSEHDLVDLIGDRGIAVGAEPHPCIVVTDGGTNGDRRLLRLLL